MAVPKCTILLVDDNPHRLSVAATSLILSGHSVLSVRLCELDDMLAGPKRDWNIRLILLRADLAPEKQESVSQYFAGAASIKLSRSAIYEVNLPELVAGILQQETLITA